MDSITNSAGFTLIELMVTIAIIGILAAVGVTGYDSYLDAVKQETLEANAATLDRALERDFIAITNDLGGRSDASGESVTKAMRCFDYIEEIRLGTAATELDNVYDTSGFAVVNLHSASAQTNSIGFLKFGELGFGCYNACSKVDDSEFYMYQCACARTGSDDENETGCTMPAHATDVYIGARHQSYPSVVMPCRLTDEADLSQGCASTEAKYFCPTPELVSSTSSC